MHFGFYSLIYSRLYSFARVGWKYDLLVPHAATAMLTVLEFHLLAGISAGLSLLGIELGASTFSDTLIRGLILAIIVINFFLFSWNDSGDDIFDSAKEALESVKARRIIDFGIITTILGTYLLLIIAVIKDC